MPEVSIGRGEINTIVGGFVGGVHTSSGKKRHLRRINSIILLPPCSLPNILFTNEEFFIQDPKQDNPVVITTTIAN